MNLPEIFEVILDQQLEEILKTKVSVDTAESSWKVDSTTAAFEPAGLLYKRDLFLNIARLSALLNAPDREVVSGKYVAEANDYKLAAHLSPLIMTNDVLTSRALNWG
jgi:hypothetical protein